MKESTYIRTIEGAFIWISRGKDKFRQECEERLKLSKGLWKDIKDEDLNELEES